MMRTFRTLLPATSTSLYDLINREVDRCNGLLLQAPLANTDVIYFGEHGREFAYIVNGGSSGLDVTNLRDIYVYGDPADSIIIVVT